MVEVYSPRDVSVAAGVTLDQVRLAAYSERIVLIDGFFEQNDAVRLVRVLASPASLAPEADRLPINIVERKRRRGGLPLAVSGSLHAAFVALFLLASSLGLLKANDTETLLDDKEPPRLVFLLQPGPGGGGGGGGNAIPLPPPPAKAKAPKPKKVSSPVPPPPP